MDYNGGQKYLHSKKTLDHKRQTSKEPNHHAATNKPPNVNQT